MRYIGLAIVILFLLAVAVITANAAEPLKVNQCYSTDTIAATVEANGFFQVTSWFDERDVVLFLLLNRDGEALLIGHENVEQGCILSRGTNARLYLGGEGAGNR